MELSELMKKTMPEIPAEILNALRSGEITKTTFDNKNEVLSNSGLQAEVGCVRLENSTYLVSMVCPMPGITPEMVEWWFWWHPQASERYQAWFPGEHTRISYRRRDREYFSQTLYPGFHSNTQYPTERIGGMKLPLRIDFVAPEEFGFSPDLMKQHNIPLIVCGHVGAFGGLISHTEMAHIFKRTEQGLVLISRFWIGERMRNPLLRKAIATETTAKSMAEHCCVEYRNLAEILPGLHALQQENA